MACFFSILYRQLRMKLARKLILKKYWENFLGFMKCCGYLQTSILLINFYQFVQTDLSKGDEKWFHNCYFLLPPFHEIRSAKQFMRVVGLFCFLLASSLVSRANEGTPIVSSARGLWPKTFVNTTGCLVVIPRHLPSQPVTEDFGKAFLLLWNGGST